MVALGPSQSAGVVWAAALLCGGLSGRTQLGHELVMRERRDLDRGSYPASEVGFKGPLVDVAGPNWLAADFAHDVRIVGVEYVDASNDLFDAGLPGVRLVSLYLSVSNISESIYGPDERGDTQNDTYWLLRVAWHPHCKCTGCC